MTLTKQTVVKILDQLSKSISADSINRILFGDLSHLHEGIVDGKVRHAYLPQFSTKHLSFSDDARSYYVLPSEKFYIGDEAQSEENSPLTLKEIQSIPKDKWDNYWVITKRTFIFNELSEGIIQNLSSDKKELKHYYVFKTKAAYQNYVDKSINNSEWK